MNRGWSIGLAGWLAGLACWAGEWQPVPRHLTRAGPAGGFDLGRMEVTVAQFVEFLNHDSQLDFPETAQIVRLPGEQYAVRRGTRRQAVAEVTAAEAEAYCRWRSRESGRLIRLPTGVEWEVAARGGVDGAPYPWGWGGQPAQLAQFDARKPAACGGQFPANGFGLHDMAGNLYEWIVADPGLPAGFRAACGGSWSERDAAFLRVDHRQWFSADYRGRDAGFRLLRESPAEP